MPQSRYGIQAFLFGLLPIVLLVLGRPLSADENLPAANDSTAAPPQVQAYSLQDYLQIALEQQPAMAAQHASLAAANTQARGVNSLPRLPIVGRSLPIRRKQACLGIAVASAGLDQTHWETVYGVTRLYYSVLYARTQKKVVQDQIARLKFYHDAVSTQVKEGTSREWTAITVDKITIHLRLTETKLAEAEQGENRALAALREAVGFAPETALQVPDEPLPNVERKIDRAEMVNLALARRGELIQAATAADIVELEVTAQSRTFMPAVRTFAAAADVHARPVPQGHANREYRPGATSLEMPTLLVGPKWARVQRARDLSARASAVVDKTRNLVALETEDAYYKWLEAANKVPQTREAADAAKRVIDDLRDGFRQKLGIKIEDVLVNEGLTAQATAALNDALYQQLLGLAALERVTAGGFDPGLACPAPSAAEPVKK